MKLRTALLAATVLAAPAAAIAQPVTGPYVSLGAGGNIFQNQNIKSFNIPALGATIAATTRVATSARTPTSSAPAPSVMAWATGSASK